MKGERGVSPRRVGSRDETRKGPVVRRRNECNTDLSIIKWEGEGEKSGLTSSGWHFAVGTRGRGEGEEERKAVGGTVGGVERIPFLFPKKGTRGGKTGVPDFRRL